MADLSGNALHPRSSIRAQAPKLRANATKGLPVVRFTPTAEGGRLRWGSTWANAHGADKASTLFWFARCVGPTIERTISGVNELGSNWFFGTWQSKYDVGHSGNVLHGARPAPRVDERLASLLDGLARHAE